MVHFISQRPSMSGTKNYLNHRTAFEGQFRMPRPQGRVSNKTVINIVTNNHCNCQMAPLLPPMPQITFPKFIQYINNFFNKGETQPPKNDPVTTETIIKPETSETVVSIPETEPTVETNLNVEEKITEATEKTEVLTVEVEEQSRVKLAKDNPNTTENEVSTTTTPEGLSTEQQTAFNAFKAMSDTTGIYKAPLWGTLAKSYTYVNDKGETVSAKNTLEFRNAMKQYMGNENDIHKINVTQHFPKKITVGGQEYTFNKDTYTNEQNWDIYRTTNGSGNIKEGQYDPKEQKIKTPGTKTTTWTGKTTFTQHKDINGDGDYKDAGEVTEFAWEATSNKSEDDVREQLKAKVDAENKLSKDDKTIAFGNITKATVTKKEEK